MKRHKYVIMSPDGQSREIGEEKLLGTGVKRFELPKLLEAGWQPVREHLFPYRIRKWFKTWDTVLCLILLEKEEA